MTRRPPIAVLVAALVLAGTGCSDESGARSEAGSAPPSTPTSTPDQAATSTTAATPRTDAATDQARRAALRGDGLGLARFGVPPEEAVAAMVPLLGEPTGDSGWQPTSGAFGGCPGDRIRAIRWEGLTLLFTDGTTDQGSSAHFFQWRQAAAPPPLATVEGLGVGATTTDAEQLYEHVSVFDDGFLDRVIEIEVEGGPLIGFLEDGVITNLQAGTPCGD